jgi:hypothetical protein
MSWTRLLRRVFDIDIEQWPQCGATMAIIAIIEHPPVIANILTYVGLPARAPPRAARCFGAFWRLGRAQDLRLRG